MPDQRPHLPGMSLRVRLVPLQGNLLRVCRDYTADDVRSEWWSVLTASRASTSPATGRAPAPGVSGGN